MRCLGFVAALCGASLLAGCSGSFSGINLTSDTSSPGVRLTGTVHGGQNPISGAHVYLFAAASGAGGVGQAAYGGAGIAASASNASVSLLNSTDTGYSDSLGAYVLYGVGWELFDLGRLHVYGGAAGLCVCAGRRPGPGYGREPSGRIDGSAGNLSGGREFSCRGRRRSHPSWSMRCRRWQRPTRWRGSRPTRLHVGSSGTALAQTGIANAFANAANLADLPSGVALATTPAGNGTVPQAEINTLANILAACVNSNGTGSACTTLFANATADGTTTGTQPTDTATAAINIAHNPAANVAALYGLASGTPPFSGGLTVQPKDLTLEIMFSGGGLSTAAGIAIDGLGNVWLANCEGSGGSVMEVSSSGALPVWTEWLYRRRPDR